MIGWKTTDFLSQSYHVKLWRKFWDEILKNLFSSERKRYTVFVVQFGINLHLWVFLKADIALAEAGRAISAFRKTHSCKLIPNWTRNRMITYPCFSIYMNSHFPIHCQLVEDCGKHFQLNIFGENVVFHWHEQFCLHVFYFFRIIIVCSLCAARHCTNNTKLHSLVSCINRLRQATKFGRLHRQATRFGKLYSQRCLVSKETLLSYQWKSTLNWNNHQQRVDEVNSTLQWNSKADVSNIYFPGQIVEETSDNLFTHPCLPKQLWVLM